MIDTFLTPWPLTSTECPNIKAFNRSSSTWARETLSSFMSRLLVSPSLLISHLVSSWSFSLHFHIISYVCLPHLVCPISVCPSPSCLHFCPCHLVFLTLSHLSFLFLLFFFCIICSVFILSLILPLLFFRSCLSFVSCNMACPSHLICSILSYFSHVPFLFSCLSHLLVFFFLFLFLCLMSSPCLSFLQFLPHLVIFPSHPVSPSYVSSSLSFLLVSSYLVCPSHQYYLFCLLLLSLLYPFFSHLIISFLFFTSCLIRSILILFSAPLLASILASSCLFFSSHLVSRACLSTSCFLFLILTFYCLTMSHLSFFLPFFPFSIIFSCLCF